MYPVNRSEPEEEPLAITCWYCERVILAAHGFISCACGCNTGTEPARSSLTDATFDPIFAARASHP
jgi:hypothetical protein